MKNNMLHKGSTISLSLVQLYNLPSAPDGGYGWIIVLAAFCNNMIADGCTFSFGLIYYELIESFDESNFITSFFLSMFNGIPLLCAPITSLLTERFTCRSIAVAGALVTSLGFFLSYFTNSFFTLFVTLGLLAPTGLSCLYITSIVMVSRYFDKKRAFATGIAVSGSGMGAIVFSSLFAFLIEKYTFKGALLILSAIILHGCVFGLLHKPLKSINIDCNKAGIFQDAYEKFVDRVDYMNLKSETLSKISEFDSTEAHTLNIPEMIASKDIDDKNALKLVTKVMNENHNGIFEKSECSMLNIPVRISTISNVSETEIMIRTISSSSSAHLVKQSICLIGIKPYIAQDRRAILGRRTVGKYVQVTMETIRETGNELDNPKPYVVAKSKFHAKYFLSLLITKKSKNVSIFKRFRLFFSGFIDFDLLLKWRFLCIVISNLLLYMCYPSVYNYLPSYAKENDIENTSLYVLLLGLGNIFGQICLGYIADFDSVQSIALYIIFSSISGMCCVVLTFYRIYDMAFIFFSIIFGLSISANFSLCSVVLVDIYSLELLTNTYGFVLFGQGLGSSVGPLIMGFIRDQSTNYDVTFILVGCGILFSNVLLLPVMLSTNKFLKSKSNLIGGISIKHNRKRSII